MVNRNILVNTIGYIYSSVTYDDVQRLGHQFMIWVSSAAAISLEVRLFRPRLSKHLARCGFQAWRRRGERRRLRGGTGNGQRSGTAFCRLLPGTVIGVWSSCLRLRLASFSAEGCWPARNVYASSVCKKYLQ